MAADVTNVKLGVCSVTFDDTDLGHTKGGVEVTYTPEYYDNTVDKYGNTKYNKTLIGESLTAKVPLAEHTLANIQVAIPAGTTSGSQITIGKDAGTQMSSDAAELVLHPIANGSDDLSEDVVFYSAIVGNEITVLHNFDGEKILEVVFEALLDESKSAGNYLGLFGDSTS